MAGSALIGLGVGAWKFFNWTKKRWRATKAASEKGTYRGRLGEFVAPGRGHLTGKGIGSGDRTASRENPLEERDYWAGWLATKMFDEDEEVRELAQGIGKALLLGKRIERIDFESEKAESVRAAERDAMKEFIREKLRSA